MKQNIAVPVSKWSRHIHLCLLLFRAQCQQLHFGVEMPELWILLGYGAEDPDIDGWRSVRCRDVLPEVPERPGVWSDGYRYALMADCIRARAFSLVGGPVWVIDSDVVLQCPLPHLDCAAGLPMLDGVQRWRDVGMPWDDPLTSICCWYQACDMARVYDERFAEFFLPVDFPGEVAAYRSTLDSGGVIIDRDTFSLSHGGAEGFDKESHAWHYFGDLKKELLA